MMANADGAELSVRSITTIANATITPPTSIIATPLVVRFSVTSASFHIGLRCSSSKQTSLAR